MNLCEITNRTSLLKAVRQPDVPLDVVTQLISPHNINMQNKYDCTALHLVVREKRWDLVPVLVQHGADVNLRDNRYNTPLHIKMQNEKYTDVPLDVVTQLISAQNINKQDRDGHTTLHQVLFHQMVSKKRWDLVPVLVQHGAQA